MNNPKKLISLPRLPYRNMIVRYKVLLLFSTFIFLLLVSVSAQKTTISGKIDNNIFTQADLQLLYKEDGISYGKAIINPDGSFKLTVNITQTDLFKLVFEEKQHALLCLSPNQNIELTLDAQNLFNIKYVKGSSSIEFCKTAYEMLISLNMLHDSINKALQTDKDVMFFSNFQSRFNKYFDTNADADEYCIELAKTTDSLQQLVNSKIVKGKVDPKEIDAFIYLSSNLMRSVVVNYSKYASYMLSLGQFDDFITNRNQKFTSFYETSVDKYLEFVEERNTIIKNNFSEFVNQIQSCLTFRDSLIINDLNSKKKEKEILAAKIIDISSKSPKTKEIESSLLKNAELANGFGKYALQEAQRKTSTMVQNYQKLFDTEREKRTNEIVDYLLLNKTDLAVLFFLDNFPRDGYQKLHQEVSKALFEKYPNHAFVKDRHKAESSPTNSTAIKSLAPDLAFENPAGKILKLSDLRGKVVLLDFWASWCRPCRQENPNVVKMYHKYHEKGFEVFSVSLDNDKTKWINAIKDDGLIWENHVSDLKYWQSAAAKVYGVSSIPSTFLIDREGRIIAKNLRGAALENALKELFE